MLPIVERHEERELIDLSRRGDTGAFGRLVRLHQDRVLGRCAAILGDADAADDAAQDCFVKAFRMLSSFRGDASFSTWLYRLATNHCLDLLRSSARRREDSLEVLIEAEGDAFERLLAGPSDPASQAEAKDLLERLLKTLPPEQRAVLLLREREGLSYEEIAETTGDSLDSVKARLRRAREALDKALRHFSAPEDV